jgi:hypothetical protein
MKQQYCHKKGLDKNYPPSSHYLPLPQKYSLYLSFIIKGQKSQLFPTGPFLGGLDGTTHHFLNRLITSVEKYVEPYGIDRSFFGIGHSIFLNREGEGVLLISWNEERSSGSQVEQLSRFYHQGKG